jgi:K(+)-stimulated pyrophosphate-energized sodium pump
MIHHLRKSNVCFRNFYRNQMMTATDVNVRTCQAAYKSGLSQALEVSFCGGAIISFMVVGLGLLGLSIMYYLLTIGYDSEDTIAQKLIYASDAISGFGFGASSIALFARVAGGIFTKGADIGADLVGKVELNLHEDDRRNPAVISDNVGDNLGDIAGMGADLFESYVGSIIAAITLAGNDIALLLLPFWISGAGVVAAGIGYFFVRINIERANQKQLLFALQKGVIVSSLLVVLFSAIIINFTFEGRTVEGWKLFGCILIGLLAGVCIGQITEYFTSYDYWPTKSITNAGTTGPATVVIQGLGIGMLSTVLPVLLLAGTILSCNALSGPFGITMSSVGMFSTLGITLATDSYGPIADNAGGIAEMAGLDARVRATTDALDAMGNTTAATGKGFAIGSAVLTALSLLSAFISKADISTTSISEPVVLAGVLIGAMLPFLFAALTMLSVQKTASAIILEVRRQFDEIPGLLEGTAEPESDKCILIATKISIQEMTLPGMYAILAPITVGFLVGPKCLAGLLGGAIATGMMLAIMMANAGGAWDNAKKYIEIEHVYGGSNSSTHKACVQGDTIGDPFKDTSGPSLNILIKLMSIIALTIAPLIKGNEDWENWYYGLVPLVTMLIINLLVYYYFWESDSTGPPEMPLALANKEDNTPDNLTIVVNANNDSLHPLGQMNVQNE